MVVVMGKLSINYTSMSLERKRRKKETVPEIEDCSMENRRRADKKEGKRKMVADKNAEQKVG